MSDRPEEHPTVLANQLADLKATVHQLGVDMRELFDRFERKIDERLGSRDKRLDDLEDRARALELGQARQQTVNGILASCGTVVFALAAGTLWKVLTG